MALNDVLRCIMLRISVMPMPASGPADKRAKRLNATATTREVSDFLQACERVGFDAPSTLRQLAAAFVSHVKKHQGVAAPIELDPRPKADRR